MLFSVEMKIQSKEGTGSFVCVRPAPGPVRRYGNVIIVSLLPLLLLLETEKAN